MTRIVMLMIVVVVVVVVVMMGREGLAPSSAGPP